MNPHRYQSPIPGLSLPPAKARCAVCGLPPMAHPSGAREIVVSGDEEA